MRATVTGILAADVATGGTFVVGYPAGSDRGSFINGLRHRLSALGKVFQQPEDMTLAFGAASVTVTYNGATTIPAGSRFTFEFDIQGEANNVRDQLSNQAIYMPAVLANIHLGSPAAGAATSYCLAQAIAGAANAVIAGALAAAGVGTADARTGRNIVAVSTNAGDTTQTITVTGSDMYGKAMKETIALNGTTIVAGKKAFKKVTQVAVSAALVGNLTVGTGNVLGLPNYLPSTGYVLKELENGATASAGTFVAGLAVSTKPTATTADIRGTYVPNSTPDASKTFSLIAALPDPSFLGVTQF